MAALLAIQPARSADSGCRPKHRVVGQQPDVVVTFKRKRDCVGRYYAALRGIPSSRVWLRERPPLEELGGAAIGGFSSDGPVLGYVRTATAFRSGADFQIVVRDLRSRRVLTFIRALDVDAREVETPYTGYGVQDLVVRRDGAAAWVVLNSAVTPHRLQVYKFDATGRTLLDESDGIDARSLTRTGDQLRWTVNGHPHSAQFAATRN